MFEILLPLTAADTPALSLTKHDLEILNVILVDDDPCVCEYVHSIFQNIGLKGTCVVSGMNAVQEILQAYHEGTPFHVVILDWNIADLNSRQIIQKVREELCESSPVFIASAYDWDDVEQDPQELGVSGFLTKPYFRSTLCNGLKAYVFNKENRQKTTTKEKSFDFTGKRFLLAEDNELNREIAIEMLSATGAEIDYAPDGLQCVEMFNRSPVNYYDLILMDIQMPVMNGYTATKNIRNLDRQDAKTIQIWAMTADAFVEDVEKAKAFGMNGHFAKPLEFLTVNTELSRFLT